MAELTGRLNIKLARGEHGVQTTIHSSRPVSASRAYVGKSVEKTVIGLPKLFSVCATAQACACSSACEVALGLTPSPAVTLLRRMLVDVETVKEHLWRMLLDWPGFVDQPARAKVMQGVMRAYARLQSALSASENPLRFGAAAVEPNDSAARLALQELVSLSEEQVFGMFPGEWLGEIQTLEDLCSWLGSAETVASVLLRDVWERSWGAAGRNQVSALPAFFAADLEPHLAGPDADKFLRAPLWQDEPRECSPYTRQRSQMLVASLTEWAGNGLLPHLVAQLVELAALQQGLFSGLQLLMEGLYGDRTEPLAEVASPGVGISQVSAARGLLVHRVALDRDRVTEYRILAPTEWNFHPRGVVTQGLSAMPSCNPGELDRLARLFVTAVDPCVEYHVIVS